MLMCSIIVLCTEENMILQATAEEEEKFLEQNDSTFCGHLY